MDELETPNLDEIMAQAFDAAEADDEPEEQAENDETSESIEDEPTGESAESDEVEVAAAETAEEISDGAQEERQEEAQVDPRYQELESIIEPRRQAWAMEGMTETQAIKQLFAISDFASQDPLGFVQWYAEQRGIDLTQLAPQQEETPEDPIQAEIAELRKQLQARESHEQQAEQAKINAEIADFRDAKDENGAAKYPHFDRVRQSMGAFLQSGQSSNLEDAYNRAIWAHPDIRAELLDQQEKAKEAERVKAAKAAAAKAAKATSGSPESRSVNSQTVSASIDDTMAAVYDRAMAS